MLCRTRFPASSPKPLLLSVTGHRRSRYESERMKQGSGVKREPCNVSAELRAASHETELPPASCLSGDGAPWRIGRTALDRPRKSKNELQIQRILRIRRILFLKGTASS